MPISLGDHVVTKNIRCEDISTSSLETNTLLVNGEILENIVSSNANVQADFSQQDDTKDDYIKHKPQIVDWTTDQLDVEIDANNIPALPYASQNLASNGVAGLTNFNFNLARKDKLYNIESNAQVNV